MSHYQDYAVAIGCSTYTCTQDGLIHIIYIYNIYIYIYIYIYVCIYMYHFVWADHREKQGYKCDVSLKRGIQIICTLEDDATL